MLLSLETNMLSNTRRDAEAVEGFRGLESERVLSLVLDKFLMLLEAELAREFRWEVPLEVLLGLSKSTEINALRIPLRVDNGSSGLLVVRGFGLDNLVLVALGLVHGLSIVSLHLGGVGLLDRTTVHLGLVVRFAFHLLDHHLVARFGHGHDLLPIPGLHNRNFSSWIFLRVIWFSNHPVVLLVAAIIPWWVLILVVL